MKRYIRSFTDEPPRYKYRVDGGPVGDYPGDYDEDLAKYYSQEPFKSVRTNDAKEAIEAWFTAEDKFPGDAAIYAYNANDELALRNWVLDNETDFQKMYNSHKCPYTYEWLIEIAEKYQDRSSGYYKYDFADQVEPFTYG